QGTYTVTWTYNDGNGNTSTQTQSVVVDDTIAPIANVASLPTVTGQCSATVTAPTATDACTGTITGTTTDALTYNAQGTYTVTWTYNDGNGNTSTQTQSVVVTNGGTIITFYQDIDGDTFGNPALTTQACTQPVGYVLNNTDCNDNEIQYLDADNDGFGSSTIVACGVANNTDCNDNNNTQNVLITFYQDIDGDTFGNPSVSTQACSQPVGYVLDNTDCNDNEIQYLDADNDGFGSTTIVAC
ncbi:HYR-like domain-containing protein, partial [Flavobacterium koreense]